MSETLPFHEDGALHKTLVVTMVVVPFALTLWAITTLWGHGVGPVELALLVGGWVLTGTAISVGYHRMLTHRAFQAHPAVRATLLVLGSMALQGTPADWAATHIRHHANADKEGDPHSPLEGFWHAHLGWLLKDRFVRTGPVHDNLTEDPVVRRVGELFPVIAVATFLIPAAIGGLAHMSFLGAWQGFLWGGAVRVFMGHHITWSVNSLSHLFGTRPYPTEDEARNNAVVALLGFGEGWHNNHHAFPKAAFLGHTWWQVDPGKWVIRALERLGLVWDVWMPDERDLERRRNPT